LFVEDCIGIYRNIGGMLNRYIWKKYINFIGKNRKEREKEREKKGKRKKREREKREKIRKEKKKEEMESDRKYL
jgi:hypothetical protein